MAVGRRPKRHNPQAERLIFTAEIENCLECEQRLSTKGNYAHSAKTVQLLRGERYVVAYTRHCQTEGCKMFGHHYHATGHLKVSLPHSTYGLEIVAYVGIEHERKQRQFSEIAEELKEKGVVINNQSVGRLYRLYISLVSGAWPQRQERIEAVAKKHEGIILKVDGLEPDQDGPGLYVMWEALSGTPVSGVLLDTADTEHITDWLKKCRELLGDVPVRGTMCDKEAALYGALQTVWPETKHGLCQLHFLNNLAEPIIEADKVLKKGLGDKIGRLPGIPKLSEAEAERRNKALLVSREESEAESISTEDRFETESEVPSGELLGDDVLPLISEAKPDSDCQAEQQDEEAVLWSAADQGADSGPPNDGWAAMTVSLEEQKSDCWAKSETAPIRAWSPGASCEPETDQNQTSARPAVTTLTELEPKLTELTWLVASPSILAGCVEPLQPAPEPTTGSETASPPADHWDNLLFPQPSPPVASSNNDPFCVAPTQVELRQRYYSYYRRGIRDALTRKSRKPLTYGGLTGYHELGGIEQALLNRQQQYGPDPYLDALQQRLETALTAMSSQAEAVGQAKELLIAVQHCLEQPCSNPAEPQTSEPPVTADRVKSDLEQIFSDLAQPSPTVQALSDKWQKMSKTWLPGILHCYDDPQLPRHNIQLESLFGRMRRHQRRVSGRKETSPLRVFGPGLLMSLSLDEAEILPWLQSIPVETYWAQRRKQEELEEPRRWMGRLRRDPVKAYAQVDEQFYAVVKEQSRASPDSLNPL